MRVTNGGAQGRHVESQRHPYAAAFWKKWTVSIQSHGKLELPWQWVPKPELGNQGKPELGNQGNQGNQGKLSHLG